MEQKKEFNQQEYIKAQKKKNMKQVNVTYKNDFVDVFRKAMQDIIDKAKQLNTRKCLYKREMEE